MAHPKPLPVQFTLTALLALFVAVWAAMALFGAGLGLTVVAAAMMGLFAYGRVNTCAEKVTIVLIVGMLVAMLLPASDGSHSSAHAQECWSGLSAVAKALRAYHAEHGQFPPACVRDKDGRPMHTWRVLILPQLGYQSLFDSYRFDEPWNGPNNSMLLASIPEEYECRAMFGRSGGGGVTTCVAVVGPQTMWPADHPMHEVDIRDGAGQTVMIGEATADLAIQWLEPRDIEFDEAASGFRRRYGASSKGGKVERLMAAHPSPLDSSDRCGGAHVVTADGKVHVLPQNLPPEQLRALLTVAGRESVDINAVVPKPPSKAGKIVSAVLLVLSLGVILTSMVRRRRALAAERQAPQAAVATPETHHSEEPPGTA